ncbi:MAG TPA: ATP-binding cassette domain-containing protein [Chitinispirillaceae bacterium]|nr:ATP-binding cassette domain-containing protein [Chitinispirillaceae bacterium]
MIKCTDLSRVFGKRTVVDKLSLLIAQGEIFGLLGPNGAGKTTTVRMLTTLLHPTDGEALVAGFNVVSQPLQVKKNIGYSPQEINLDRDLSGYQNLLLHGLFHRMPDAAARSRELLVWAGIESQANDVVRCYSGGMQRRLQIARSVMHNPSILFLDEPTVGLDPQIRRTIWDLIRSLRDKGIGVLLTTHYIEEAEKLCSRVGIMNKGKLIACDTPEHLKLTTGAWIVEVQEKDTYDIDYRHFTDKAEAYEFARSLGNGSIRIRESTLEDVFIHYAGERFQS